MCHPHSGFATKENTAPVPVTSASAPSLPAARRSTRPARSASVLDRRRGDRRARRGRALGRREGASNATFAEVTATQQSADRTASRRWPRTFVPINAKSESQSRVGTGSRSSPRTRRGRSTTARRSWRRASEPTRPKPRSRAGVPSAKRWIRGADSAARHATRRRSRALDPRAPASQPEVRLARRANRASPAILEKLSARTMQRYDTSRRSRFDELDRPALTVLPPARARSIRTPNRSCGTASTAPRSVEGLRLSVRHRDSADVMRVSTSRGTTATARCRARRRRRRRHDDDDDAPDERHRMRRRRRTARDDDEPRPRGQAPSPSRSRGP